MRIFLIGLLAFSALGYWYQTTAGICPAPLSYRIGTIDESFGIDKDFVIRHLAVAEAVWETEANRELFVYDESSDFVVDFIFDNRQELADSEVHQKMALDAKKAENEELFSVTEKLQQEYQSLTQSYQNQVDSYEAQLAEYNKQVSIYNDRGGAPADVFAQLQQQQKELDREFRELTTTSNELDNLADKINELSDRGNQLVELYNKEVADFNSQFGFSREFTQGDYQGDKINIYKFSDEKELENVLAHELGHALSIGHVDDESSVMYYLLEDTGTSPVLSVEDREALFEVCGTGDELDSKIKKMIRGVINNF